MDQCKVIKSMVQLPPDADSLNHLIERRTCIFYNQLNYNILEHPASIGHHWELVNGQCLPVHNITHPPFARTAQRHWFLKRK